MMTLGRREQCLRKHSGKGSFRGIAYTPDAKLAPPATADSIVDQNRLKPRRGRPLGLQGELKSEGKMEIPA